MTNPKVSLSLASEQHEELRKHLFCGDGREAVAVALCGRRAGEHRHRLLVREVHIVPYEACSQRSSGRVRWDTEAIVPALEAAEQEDLSIVKIHSHPDGLRSFSGLDNVADEEFLPCVAGWTEVEQPHGSAVMLPDGSLFGRVLWPGGGWEPIELVGVVGSDLKFAGLEGGRTSWLGEGGQAFGSGTTALLGRLSAGVVGCSGTGSPVVEQLARLGLGELVLVDHDRMEERNVGRILNSTARDADARRAKVEVLAEAIRRLGLGTKVRLFPENLWTRKAVEAVGECDVVFGCMDTHEGRFVLNLLATDYVMPYFDVGVRLEGSGDPDCSGGVREVCGSVHYLQPGRSSLMSRGVISMDRVRAEGLRRRDPAAHEQEVEEGYISGVEEQRPAVISVNMFAASLAVNDFLARLHAYRDEPNASVASIGFSLASLELFGEGESARCPLLAGRVGRGDIEPRLDLTELGISRRGERIVALA